jgi:hypothetical protein
LFYLKIVFFYCVEVSHFFGDNKIQKIFLSKRTFFQNCCCKKIFFSIFFYCRAYSLCGDTKFEKKYLHKTNFEKQSFLETKIFFQIFCLSSAAKINLKNFFDNKQNWKIFRSLFPYFVPCFHEGINYKAIFSTF